MAIMIIYETVEGQTGKIVQFIQGILRRRGEDCVLVNTADRFAKLSYKGVEKVILAAPVHERRHPRSFEVFLAADRAELEARETLMLSVSLKAAFEDGKDDAKAFLAEMEERTGFSATQNALIAGAVRQGSYDYFSSQILRHAILAERDAYLAEGDHEFTDWDALKSLITAFAEK